MPAAEAASSGKAITAQRNCSIDICRYICALLVVVNHYDPFFDLNDPAILSFNHTLASLPVPFFAAVAGFYFTRRLEAGERALLPYLKRLVIPYAAWSALYFAIGFFTARGMPAGAFVKNCLVRFLISGSEFHLWYFPAVMISAVITAAFFRLRAEKLLVPLSFLMYAYQLLQTDYFWLFPRLAMASAMPAAIRADYSLLAFRRIFFIAFPYFCAGYLAKKLTEKDGFFRRKSGVMLILCAALYPLEYFTLAAHGIYSTDIMLSIYLIPVALVVFLNEHPASDRAEAAKRCRFLAGLTFYAHPAAFMAIGAVGRHVFHVALPHSVLYLLICALCAALAAAVMKADNKYLNMVSC